MTNLLATLTSYKAKKNQIEQIEKELEKMKQEILSCMEGKTEITCGQYKATNKPCTRKGIDEKTLKEKYPEIAKEVEKITSYNRFSVT